jgi:hypothetical protein
MNRALFCHAAPREAARALAEGAALAGCVADAGAPPVALYGAVLTGAGLALGAHQRAAQAVRLSHAREASVSVVRRASGGPTMRAGDGVVYLALGLRTASTLLECPRDRVLNRNVRGLLAGLSAGGVAAHYFGREFVSLARRPAVGCHWSRDAHGHVLLEFFLGVGASHLPDDALVAYPSRVEPALNGKEPITFAEAYAETERGTAPEADALIELALVRGYAQAYQLELESVTAPDVSPRVDLAIRDDDDDALRWSQPHEVPIGFVSAGLAVRDGVIRDARLAGDFFADADGTARLRSALVDHAPSPELLVAAINATYGPRGVVIEGLRSLAPVLSAFLELSTS